MVRLTHRAQKDLAELPPKLREKAEILLRRLDNEPTLGKKLLGALREYRSARLGRSHRVIYKLENQGPLVMTISPRRDSYR